MSYHLLMYLVLTLPIIETKLLTTYASGVLVFDDGPVYEARSVGDMSLYIPLLPKDSDYNNCTIGIKDELYNRVTRIFPTLQKPQIRSSPTTRWVIVALIGLAILAIAGAFGLATGAMIMATENRKAIAENREAINGLRDNINQIHDEFIKVKQITDEIIGVITKLEQYINNVIKPTLEKLECQVQQNSLRSLMNSYWIETSVKFAAVLKDPLTAASLAEEELELMSNPDFQEMTYNRWGIQLKGYETDYYCSFMLIEIDKGILHLQVSLMEKIPNGNRMVKIQPLTISNREGNVSMITPSRGMMVGKDIYSVNEGCVFYLGSWLCLNDPKDSSLDLNCSTSECQFEKTTITRTFIGDGEGGIIVNCNISTCLCDGVYHSDIYHFQNNSCTSLVIDGKFQIKLRSNDHFIEEPIKINMMNPDTIPPINLKNNISTLNHQLNDLNNKLIGGDHLAGLTNNVGVLTIWLIVLTICMIVELATLILLMCKIKKFY